MAGVDISHARLVDLTRLADQAKPFYEWIERTFQDVLSETRNFTEILNHSDLDDLRQGIRACYSVEDRHDVPFLFDGVGRTYPHSKACYYFFSWTIRDAPQQRLAPMVQRIVQATRKPRTDVEIDVLAQLITKYRKHVRTFSWEAIREVIVDRLEGSRRSIKGHEKETIVRSALLVAIQSYYETHRHYGVFGGVEIPASQVSIGSESYDVSVNLLDGKGITVSRMLVPIKTRETEGGGHSHLFTRDIMSAITSAKSSGSNDYLAVIIVAKNWSRREARAIEEAVDYLVNFEISPSEFIEFGSSEQESLNQFVSNVLDGVIHPKKTGDNE